MCAWYFSPDDFDADKESEVVHRVRADGLLPLPVKKQLILCWFDTVYSKLIGDSVDVSASRANLSHFISSTGFSDLEGWLDADA